MLEPSLRQLFSCCFPNDSSDLHQISYVADPKCEEGRGGGPPLQVPTSSPSHLQKLPPGSGLGNSSARSQSSAPSTARSLTAEERQKEKERLQDMVKEFAKAVVQSNGQQCQWLDPAGVGGPKAATYSIDKALKIFSLRPDGAPVVSLEMAEIREVLKESRDTPFSKFRLSRPPLGSAAEEGAEPERRFVCMQWEPLDGTDELNYLGMLLPNPYERDRFYTCMKILRWAMESRREQS